MSPSRCRPLASTRSSTSRMAGGHVAVDAVDDQLAVAEDRVEWRAQLVRHVGEELRLVAAGDFELVRFGLQLAEQPRVLQRDRRLGGEGREQGHDVRREFAGDPATHGQPAEEAVLVQERKGQDGAAPRAQQRSPERSLVGPGHADVGDLDRRPGERGPPERSLALADARRAQDLGDLGIEDVGRPQVEDLGALVVLPDGAAPRAGQLGRARHDGLQDRVEVERRADGLADVAERAELLDRAAQLAGALLQLAEQPRVLDGDDRLVGEGLQQLDPTRREGADFPAGHRDRADDLRIAPHRHHEEAPHATCPPALVGLGEGLKLFDVRNLERASRARNLMDGIVVRASRKHAPHAFQLVRRDVVMTDEVHEVALVTPDSAVERAAEPYRVADDGVEHRLRVGRRARDDPQDLAGRRLLLERLGQRAVARLQLGEQADVLEGDDRLVGEGLQQGDLWSVNGPTSARHTVMAPIGLPSRSIGHRRARYESRPRAGNPGRHPRGHVRRRERGPTARSRMARPVTKRRVGGAGKNCRDRSGPRAG